jgi:hypothetical protein
MNSDENQLSTTGAAEGSSAPIVEVLQDAPVSQMEKAFQSVANDAAPIEVNQQDEATGGDHSPVTLEPLPQRTNVLQEGEIFLPWPENRNMDVEVKLAVPSTTWERTQKLLDAYPNVDLEKNLGGDEWSNTLAQAGYTVPAGDGFQATVTREGSQFRQAVKSEKGMLAAAQPRLKEDTGGASWSGEKAVLRVKSILGMGSLVQVPLWHSGFWVTLKAPTEGELLELNRQLNEEKITLGRMTYGLAFANSSVFFAGKLMDFVLDHVLETTLKPGMLDAKSLRDRIKSPDLQILAWGMASTIWPKGFPYARAVLDPTGSETKVIRELIAVGKLLWTDTASLSPWQIAHMAQRFGQVMGEDGLEKYRTEFTRGKGRRVQLSERVAVNLKVPSLTEYVNSGYKWVNNITAMVDQAFQMPPGSQERDKYIIEQGKATYMRQYAHWVESVVVDDNNVIDHVETVEQLLDALSEHNEFREAYFKGVREYIEDSTVSLIAIVATEEVDKSELPRFPNLLPIDAMSVFFILIVQMAMQIQNR